MTDDGERTAAVLREVERIGVIGIIRCGTPEEALARARALVDVGVTVLEVSLTTPDAADVIAALDRDRRDTDRDVVIGAGTVCTDLETEQVLRAGARFVVSPVLVEAVVATAAAADVASFPGCATPTEVLRAVQLGATAAKIFPAQLWSPAVLAALLEAMPALRTVPTGGVGPETAGDWIRAGATAVGVGSSLSHASDPRAAFAQLRAAIRASRADR